MIVEIKDRREIDRQLEEMLREGQIASLINLQLFYLHSETSESVTQPAPSCCPRGP